MTPISEEDALWLKLVGGRLEYHTAKRLYYVSVGTMTMPILPSAIRSDFRKILGFMLERVDNPQPNG